MHIFTIFAVIRLDLVSTLLYPYCCTQYRYRINHTWLLYQNIDSIFSGSVIFYMYRKLDFGCMDLFDRFVWDNACFSNFSASSSLKSHIKNASILTIFSFLAAILAFIWKNCSLIRYIWDSIDLLHIFLWVLESKCNVLHYNVILMFGSNISEWFGNSTFYLDLFLICLPWLIYILVTTIVFSRSLRESDTQISIVLFYHHSATFTLTISVHL